MITSDLKSTIDSAINRNESLLNISVILKKYKEKGVTQSEAIEMLELMRIDTDENYEDRLLEILDIVTGFCDPKYTVW